MSSPAAQPIVIAHRGASGYCPEHTAAAYELAVEQGADFIEPDVVVSRDGVLVVRHENEIGGTTDVAQRPEFAARKTRKIIDGATVEGWFTEDFSFAELKTLRAVERLPNLRPNNDSRCPAQSILSFAEVIDLLRGKERETGRTIGIYPETKHPSYFAALGLPLEQRLLDTLHAGGFHGRDAKVFIQSFEVGNLQRLRRMTEFRLVQLLGEADTRPFDLASAGDPRDVAALTTAEGLRAIAAYADAIGPHKALIVPRDPNRSLLPPSDLVRNAHAAGLSVHPWTFRSENFFLPQDFRRGDPNDVNYPAQHGDSGAELEIFLRLGVDGVFADFPDAAIAARKRLQP